jgi:hypothetical protein
MANLKRHLRNWMPPVLVEALRSMRPPPPITGASVYANARATIAAAQAAGLSVPDFVHKLWGGPEPKLKIKKLHDLSVFSSDPKTIVEIGAGTGRFTEQTLKFCHPQSYQIYELDRDWSEWLTRIYPVEDCHADGKTLTRTKSKSADLIHAHGVFVHTPFMISLRYFEEIARVAAPGAFVVFDILSERCFDEKATKSWLDSDLTYPCFLSAGYVVRLFEDRGFELVDSFLWPFGVGYSDNLIFRTRHAR